jgi:hypothetical protein
MLLTASSNGQRSRSIACGCSLIAIPYLYLKLHIALRRSYVTTTFCTNPSGCCIGKGKWKSHEGVRGNE